MPSLSGCSDLFLQVTRKLPLHWIPNKLSCSYRQTTLTQVTEFGKIYLQGTCIDSEGKELSIVKVGKLVDQYGPKVMDLMEGNFAIAVEDKRYGVWFATDCSATYPIYYKINSEELILTTRPENLTVNNLKDLDIGGIVTFLNTGYPWGDLTLLNNWKVLRPGHILQVDNNDKFSIQAYFEPESDKETTGFTSPKELLKEIDAGLISIASRYKRILIPLSGGVDSRLIAVQCHKLGIPFEAITFVANADGGDDFDIASRLAKIFNVKHHRWQWSPSTSDCIDNFSRLCIASGGSNDAYTSYPDGMKYFASTVSEFDCIMRGDHEFGFGKNTNSLFHSAMELTMNYKDDIKWTLNNTYQNNLNIESIFQEQEKISLDLKGIEVNSWRHRSRRLSRNPRFHLAVGQLQSQFTNVTYPLLTKTIIKKMARTELPMRNDKNIAREALSLASSADVLKIPHSSKSTWKNSEPLLNLPKNILSEMTNIVQTKSILSELVDESGIVSRSKLCENGGPTQGVPFKHTVKHAIKNILPSGLVQFYQQTPTHSYPKVSAHLIFKRLFAVKTYLNKITR